MVSLGVDMTDMTYATFWRRFGAYWLDLLIMIPLVAISFWGQEQSRLFQLYWFLPGMLIGVLYHVYLVKRYGGTPGKLILNIKIAKLDGSDVGYREASLRYLVLFCLTFSMSFASIMVISGMTDAEYFSMDWTQRAEYTIENVPNWYHIAQIALNIWIWSEFIVMLTNKKRRALHDFMAGTVVINKSTPNNSLKRDVLKHAP